jgi:hypothetical protein
MLVYAVLGWLISLRLRRAAAERAAAIDPLAPRHEVRVLRRQVTRTRRRPGVPCRGATMATSAAMSRARGELGGTATRRGAGQSAGAAAVGVPRESGAPARCGDDGGQPRQPRHVAGPLRRWSPLRQRPTAAGASGQGSAARGRAGPDCRSSSRTVVCSRCGSRGPPHRTQLGTALRWTVISVASAAWSGHYPRRFQMARTRAPALRLLRTAAARLPVRRLPPSGRAVTWARP